jgi:hypothetical protein
MAKRKDNPENEGENLNEGNNGDDNFGLPDIEYKPLDSTEETSNDSSTLDFSSDMDTEKTTQNSEQAEREKNYTYTPAEEPKSNAPVIIAVIIGLVLVVAGFLIYQYVYKPKAEKTKKEQLAKQEAEKKRKEEAALLAKQKEEAERLRLEQEKAAAATAAPAQGTIETLSGRTGRYYVVVSSDIDDDLIMDYAKKLSANGTSTQIIPPYGKTKFSRLAVGNFDSFAEAQTSADGLKATYGDGIWVIKY